MIAGGEVTKQMLFPACSSLEKDLGLELKDGYLMIRSGTFWKNDIAMYLFICA